MKTATTIQQKEIIRKMSTDKDVLGNSMKLQEAARSFSYLESQKCDCCICTQICKTHE